MFRGFGRSTAGNAQRRELDEIVMIALLATLLWGGELCRHGTAIDGKTVRRSFDRQSGQWKGKAAIAGGRTTVRASLFMGAMVAPRHNPVLKAFYQRLIAAGKPRMVALIATARKLLTILDAILWHQKPWQIA